MAGHPARAGYPVHVYDIAKGPVEELAKLGAAACGNSRVVAEKTG